MINEQLVLAKDQVCLKTLSASMRDELALMAADKRIWVDKRQPLEDPEQFKTLWFDSALAKKQTSKRWPFAVYFQDKLIGSTSYYEISEQHKRLTIGYTWYHPDYWGSGVNKIVKHLMLKYAFEVLQFNRVAFCVDSLNERSCAAVLKLGAKKEGVLRKHIIRADGSERDSVIFSIIKSEW